MKNEEIQSSNSETRPLHRPFSVTILTLVVLIFTSLNTFRACTAINTWDFLTTLQPNVPIFYFVITGSIWGLAGLILTGGFISKKRWTLNTARIVVVLYMFYYWLDRLVIAESTSIINRWQFSVSLTFLLLLMAFWTLGRQTTRDFLSK
jgi:hypothetical protein